MICCTLEANFQFLNVNYDQTEGASMGGTFSVVICNIYMISIENKALAISLFPPISLRRYADDMFARFDCSPSANDDRKLADEFMSVLNKQNRAVQFTAEYEENNQISFLDVFCKTGDSNSYTTEVHRKKTHTDVYINWNSSHPMQQKLGVLKTLLYRAKGVCSSPDLLEKEVQYLKTTFAAKGYPY